MNTLKTVGLSGQLSLGKRFAGRHFEMQVEPDGRVILTPVTVIRRPVDGARLPKFQRFPVERIEVLSRDELHRRDLP
jgi:hypothetical protein